MLLNNELKMLKTVKDGVGCTRELGYLGNKQLTLPYQATLGLQHYNFHMVSNRIKIPGKDSPTL